MPTRKAANDSYRTGTVSNDTSGTEGDSLRCLGNESDTSTIGNSSYECNEDHSDTACIKDENAAQPIDLLAKLCSITYERIQRNYQKLGITEHPTEKYDPKEHYIQHYYSANEIDWARKKSTGTTIPNWAKIGSSVGTLPWVYQSRANVSANAYRYKKPTAKQKTNRPPILSGTTKTSTDTR